MAENIEGAGGMMPTGPLHKITPDPTGTSTPKCCTASKGATDPNRFATLKGLS